MGGYRPGCDCGGRYRKVWRGLFLAPGIGEYVHKPGCPHLDPNYRPLLPRGRGGVTKAR
jgi:hypothetical protein